MPKYSARLCINRAPWLLTPNEACQLLPYCGMHTLTHLVDDQNSLWTLIGELTMDWSWMERWLTLLILLPYRTWQPKKDFNIFGKRAYEKHYLSCGLDFLVPSVPTSFLESATDAPSVGQFHSANRPKSRKIGSGRRNIWFKVCGDNRNGRSL